MMLSSNPADKALATEKRDNAIFAGHPVPYTEENAWTSLPSQTDRPIPFAEPPGGNEEASEAKRLEKERSSVLEHKKAHLQVLVAQEMKVYQEKNGTPDNEMAWLEEAAQELLRDKMFPRLEKDLNLDTMAMFRRFKHWLRDHSVAESEDMEGLIAMGKRDQWPETSYHET